MIERVTKVAQNFGVFSSLPFKAQKVLLEHNLDLVVGLRVAYFFQMKTGLHQILTSLGFEEVESGKNMIRMTLNSNNIKEHDYKKIEYEKYNSMYNKEYQRSVEEIGVILQSESRQSVPFNQSLIKILSYILLFCSDFSEDDLDLDLITNVQNVQKFLIHIAKRYVFSIYPEAIASSVFTKMMQCLEYLREFVRIENIIRTPQNSSENVELLCE